MHTKTYITDDNTTLVSESFMYLKYIQRKKGEKYADKY